MTSILNYTAWFNIFALALNLVNDPVFQEGVIVQARWGEPSEVGLFASDGAQALYIEFFTREHHQLILGYAMLPWQEMAAMSNEPFTDDGSVFPEHSVLTVTPFAVIYKIEPHAGLKGHEALISRASDAADHLFSYEESQTVIFAQDAYTSQAGLQVMSLTEYPWYVDIHAAIPGSKSLDGKEFLDEFNAKMIRLTLVPGSGPGASSWWAPQAGAFGPEIHQIEEELIEAYLGGIDMCMREFSPNVREKAFEATAEKISALLKGSGLQCDSMPEFCGELLERLLFYDPVAAIPFDPNDPYPDYVPKMTPDELTDFMPGISMDIQALPPAELASLPVLIRLYKEYRKAARQNPGEWTDGNLVLGAKPEEYRPSKEELLLAESGERIRIIAGNEGSKKVKAVMKEHRSKKKKIKYKRFSFVHMDVMGSGRFFYVEEIEKIYLKLY